MRKKILKKKTVSKCHRCDQLCCKYITEKISAPRTIRDFDGLLWQLLHKNVKAFKDSSGWYLIIYNACVHLKRDGQCSVYENRPITCREHSVEKCEFKSSVSRTAIIYFDGFKSLESYCRKKFKTWDNRF